MSHPNPHHDPDNVREHDSKFSPKAKALMKGTTSHLKKMISEPSGKEWFAKHGMPKGAKHKALNKESGHYVSPQGVRYLSKKEQKEKTKNWPKSNGKSTVAFPTTGEHKREHQSRFGRAHNE